MTQKEMKRGLMSGLKFLRPIALTALCLSAAAGLSGANGAHADAIPVVEITAKRFAFSPDRITLKQGKPVKLRVHSEDVTHGFFLRPLKLDEEIPPAKPSK